MITPDEARVVSLIVPPCCCPYGQEENALQTVHLPTGWQWLTPETRDYFTWVECPECKKILKYYGTRRCYIPGFTWQT